MSAAQGHLRLKMLKVKIRRTRCFPMINNNKYLTVSNEILTIINV